MADIRHRVGIAVPAERIYEVLTTLDGLAGWWTRTVDGDPGPGGTINFYFGGRSVPGAVMEVTAAEPGRLVRWHCVGGPDEWVGTDVVFELGVDGDETALKLTHANWREPVDFMHHCSTKWAYFMLGLRTWLQGGKSVAHPDDDLVSSWG